MGAAEWLGEVAQAWLAAGAATLLVLATRAALRRLAGARAVVLAWALVPVAVLAVLLPPREGAPTPWTPEVAVAARADAGGAAPEALLPMPARDLATPLLLAWLLGALALLARQAVRESRYRRALGRLQRFDGDAPDLRRATAGAPVPAVVGLWRPRVVLPADFEARHPGAEGALVLAHERAHLAHHDTRALALAELLRAALWPQPLLHLALPRLRRDLELAADAAVLAAHPGARRAYADALLRGALDAPPPPLACAWPASPHPLTERIAMLIAIPPTRPRAARALLPLLAALVAGAAWAAQPAVAPVPEASTATAVVPASDGAWLIHAELRVDEGEPVRIDVRGAPGGEHRIASGAWSALLRALPATDPANVQVEVQLFRDGEPMATPRLVGSRGAAMGIQLQLPEGGELLSMGIAVHVLEAGAEAPAFGIRAPAAPPVLQADARAVATPVDISGLPASVFTGSLVLEVDVDAAGRVSGVRVRDTESVVDPALQARAIAAARQWRFAPAIRDGEAVASSVLVPLSFAPEAPDAP